MYGLIGKIVAAPGKRDELLGLLLGASGAMPGCHLYVVATDPTDANAIWITEAWENEAAHKASLQIPAVQATIAKARPLIAGFGERFVTSPVGGIGLAGTVPTGADNDDLPEEAADIRIDSAATPVIDLPIAAQTNRDRESLASALRRLAAEDPTFRARTDEETGRTILSGTGELHLDAIVARLRGEFGISADIGQPQVAYRETITRPAEIDYTHKKQSGGQGQFARVKLRLEPAPRGAGFSFADACGGLLAPEYVVGLDRGVRAVLGSGVKAGFPVVDVRVAVTDGAFHDADSSALAFEIAGRAAMREGLAKADPILLEPIMRIRVDAPAEFRESVIADLHTRRGEIAAIGDGVEGTVPMQNLFGYVSQLRGMTRGEGRLTLTFERYDPLPLHPEGGDDHPFRPSRRMRA